MPAESLRAPGARDCSFWKRRYFQVPDCESYRGGPSLVREMLKRFAASGLTWPLAVEVTDAVLKAGMCKNARKKQAYRQNEMK